MFPAFLSAVWVGIPTGTRNLIVFLLLCSGPTVLLLSLKYYAKGQKQVFDQPTVKGTVIRATICWFVSLVGIPIVAIMLINAFGILPALTTEVAEQVPIYALQDNAGANGRWYVLGSGYLNGSVQFTFYTVRAGTLYPETEPEGNVTITESANSSPTVYTYRPTFKNKVWLNYLSVPDIKYRRDLVVPPGTVKQDYSSDLK